MFHKLLKDSFLLYYIIVNSVKLRKKTFLSKRKREMANETNSLNICLYKDNIHNIAH